MSYSYDEEVLSRSCSPISEADSASVIPYEMCRDPVSGIWHPISIGSLDWRETAQSNPKAVVVRACAIVSHEAPQRIVDNIIGNIATYLAISISGN